VVVARVGERSERRMRMIGGKRCIVVDVVYR